ncbi:MAG: primosomal protein N', partial [Bacteroidota bacterium]|nr:primosomal protein N' [Bacteroidota bacterium]
MTEPSSLFAEVLLPLPVPRTFTYIIPEEFRDKVMPGVRVVVQFGKRKIYSGVITALHGKRPSWELKDILSVLDDKPVVVPVMLELWKWIAKYYLCTPGEVMNAALPSALKLSSESRVRFDPDVAYNPEELSEKELLLLEALHNRETIGISEIPKILEQHKVLPVLKTLLDRGLLKMEEEVEEKYRPRMETFVHLADNYREDETLFRDLFNSLEKKAKKQLELLIAFLAFSHYGSQDMDDVPRAQLLKNSGSSSAILHALVEKGVLEIYEKKVEPGKGELSEISPASIELADFQQQAMCEIKESFEKKDVVLLHGVTSSGKTEMYIRLIDETIRQGKQVLYLLPEIALTTQIINRLKKYFGGKVGVYHSRFYENERAEIWNSVLKGGYEIILGARSAVFLPFTNLGLVIVDEEHDSSFKQYDPSPRYNGRDVALYLAHLHGAKTILGSATPSMESYYNAQEGKYALVQMMERYGNLEMPEIEVVDIRQEYRWKKMKSYYSSVLLNQLQMALANHEQAILFQNRRGFSLRIECETCHWMPSCKNCDVTLVYHKKDDRLRCHYCGYTVKVPS